VGSREQIKRENFQKESESQCNASSLEKLARIEAAFARYAIDIECGSSRN